MAKTRCTNCGSIISLEKPREGSIITCSACGVELEIVRTDPFAVDFIEEWEEDWEEQFQQQNGSIR